MKVVHVTVPASSANLGPGFDCLALALGLHNVVEFGEAEAGLTFSISGEGAETLPRDASNLVVRAAAAVFRKVGRAPGGLRIRQENQIPLLSGLGSSAAAILGGVVAANALLDDPLSHDEMLRTAVELEGHPDNVCAALLGGLVVSSYSRGDLVHTSVPIQPMRVVVALPQVSLSTAEARAALPKSVPLENAAYNIGRAALVVQALANGDYELLKEAMHDRLHEPVRQKFIPGYRAAVEAAQKSGAATVAISGAGPSLIAFAPDGHQAIARAMARALEEATGKSVRVWVLPVDTQGISISLMAPEMPFRRPSREPTRPRARPAPEPEPTEPEPEPTKPKAKAKPKAKPAKPAPPPQPSPEPEQPRLELELPQPEPEAEPEPVEPEPTEPEPAPTPPAEEPEPAVQEARRAPLPLGEAARLIREGAEEPPDTPAEKPEEPARQPDEPQADEQFIRT
jgi:homoserine kinase